MSVLLRIVAGDAGLIPDPAHRFTGRGAWIHPDPGCLSDAERRRAFPRALRQSGPLDSTMVREYLGAGFEPVAGAPAGAEQVSRSSGRPTRPESRTTRREHPVKLHP